VYVRTYKAKLQILIKRTIQESAHAVFLTEAFLAFFAPFLAPFFPPFLAPAFLVAFFATLGAAAFFAALAKVKD